jgi:hypothetical protein
MANPPVRNAVEHGPTRNRTGSDDTTEDGRKGVTVTVGELEDRNGFRVADDAIPEKEREEVFGAGHSTSEDGTGFGLSIVEEIVTAHGRSLGAIEKTMEALCSKYPASGLWRPETSTKTTPTPAYGDETPRSVAIGAFLPSQTQYQTDMKIRQNVKHFAFKQALTAPVLGDVARDKLVSMHTDIFLGKAEKSHREERREHLDEFFEATMDTYVAALGYYPEAKAREITHAQANFDFYNHGWTEMMEFPGEELGEHHDRYAEFFEDHDISIDDPLGEFRPEGGIAGAPSTPERLDAPVHPYAEGGFADDVYVETPDGDVIVGGQAEPDGISPKEYVADG